MKARLLLALSLATIATIATPALPAQTGAQTSTTWTIDSAHSGVNFQIRHLGVSNVHGSLGGLKGTVTLDSRDVTKSAVNATIDASTVTTGNEARDKHLKSPDFFDVAKNPTLTFKSTSVTNAGGKLQLLGDLTLNGVTKPVTLDLDGPSAPQKGPGGKTVSGFSAAGVLKRSDFSFGSKFAPPLLGDEVRYSIDLEIDKQ